MRGRSSMTNVARVEVSRGALLQNIAAFRRVAGPGVMLSAAIKANGYGHGLEEVARCIEGDIDAFQVDDLSELRRLRTISKGRAMVLGYVADEDVAETVGLGGELALYDPEQIPALRAAGARVHLKIDTGFGRLGVGMDSLESFVHSVERARIEVTGVYSHLACAKTPNDPEGSQSVDDQLRAFEGVAAYVRDCFPDAIRHLSNTAGAMADLPTFDLQRLGIGIYGESPTPDLESFVRPSLRWVSCLAQVKPVKKGGSVGYDRTFIAPEDMILGLVPQGYSDGYSRMLSNVGEVLVDGVRCRVVGRVSMNMLAIDLSNVPNPQRAAEVVLIGAQGDDAIRPEQLAGLSQTNLYEVLTSISPALPRVIVE
ncbi:alanine racemase [bacterium]|nr:MAG: alanine racemase [bacterium]